MATPLYYNFPEPVSLTLPLSGSYTSGLTGGSSCGLEAGLAGRWKQL